MAADRPVLLLGLDAGDPALVERWTDDGTLRHLARLRSEGTYGRLDSAARYLAGSPWPTFYTGQPPSHHGIYHDFQWRHESTGYATPAWDWVPALPFWRRLNGEVRVVAYDVPMTLGCQSATGVEVTGWASHDKLAPPSTHPPDLLDEIRGRFGAWSVKPEAYGRSSLRELLELRRTILENVERSTELVKWLLGRPWDLALAVFGGPHRGGHRLWDRSSIRGPIPDGPGTTFDGALRDIYRACDRAVGELATLAEGATLLVFSVHGMMVNTARIDLLDGMLANVLHGEDAATPEASWVRRLGEALPLPLRRLATRAVPQSLQNLLVTRWSAGGLDWSETEAFTLRADLQGYVRINLEGREPRGIVPPSAYEELCERLMEGLASFRDADTGEPVVAEVRRATPDLLPEGPRADRLPDLIVRWVDASAVGHRAVVSSRHGRVERRTPGRIPNGRSGNHRPEGFLIARGEGIPAGGRLPSNANILDLAPTVVELLGARVDVPLAGRPLPLRGPPT